MCPEFADCGGESFCGPSRSGVEVGFELIKAALSLVSGEPRNTDLRSSGDCPDCSQGERSDQVNSDGRLVPSIRQTQDEIEWRGRTKSATYLGGSQVWGGAIGDGRVALHRLYWLWRNDITDQLAMPTAPALHRKEVMWNLWWEGKERKGDVYGILPVSVAGE